MSQVYATASGHAGLEAEKEHCRKNVSRLHINISIRKQELGKSVERKTGVVTYTCIVQ